MANYAENKTAKFDYEIMETLEAGLVLTGQEVKSIRTGHASLKSGYVTLHGNQVLLINAHIPKYKFAGQTKDYDPERSRPLLLKQKEIDYLKGKTAQTGLTIVPIKLYNSGRHIKLQLAIARGKKKYDKRRTIKDRESKRELGRALRGRN